MPPSPIQGGLCSELVQSGCIIKEQVGEQIPRDALLRPWGSADLLAAHFKNLDSIVHFNIVSE